MKMTRSKHYPGEYLGIRFDEEIEVVYGHVETIDDAQYPGELMERQLSYQFHMHGLSLETSKEWGDKLFDVIVKKKYGRVVPLENDDGGSISFVFSCPGRGAMPVTEFTFNRKISDEFNFETEERCKECNGRGYVPPKIPSQNTFAHDKCEPCHGQGYLFGDSCKTCALSFIVEHHRCTCEKIPIKHDIVFKCNLFSPGCTVDEFREKNESVRCHATECQHHPYSFASNKDAGKECVKCKENTRAKFDVNLQNLFAARKE